MRFLLIFFSLSLFSAQTFSQTFTRVDLQSDDRGDMLVESQVRVEEGYVFLRLDAFDTLTDRQIWEQENRWPVSYEEPGYIHGENLRTGGSDIRLLYSQERILELKEEINNDSEFKLMIDEAKDIGVVACEEDLESYEAIVLETNRMVTTIMQMICYK